MTRRDAFRFPSPLIKPDVQISRIRLSDRLHHKAHVGDTLRTRFSSSTSSSHTHTREGIAVCRDLAFCVVCEETHIRVHSDDDQLPDRPRR